MLTFSIPYFFSLLEHTQPSTKMALAKVTSMVLTPFAHLLIFFKVVTALTHAAILP